MNVQARVALESVGIILLIAGVVALLLTFGWYVEWDLGEPFISNITAAILIISFLILVALTGAFLWLWRTDRYEGRPSSPLHMPLTWSFAAVAAYFGIFCIDAIDIILHPPGEWPLLRDPEVRLITRLLLLTIVVPRWWLLWRIYWGERRARESLAVPPDLDDREFGEVPVR